MKPSFHSFRLEIEGFKTASSLFLGLSMLRARRSFIKQLTPCRPTQVESANVERSETNRFCAARSVIGAISASTLSEKAFFSRFLAHHCQGDQSIVSHTTANPSSSPGKKAPRQNQQMEPKWGMGGMNQLECPRCQSVMLSIPPGALIALKPLLLLSLRFTSKDQASL